MVMSMASYKCPDCNYVYDESAGNVHEGFSPGTPWHLIPEDWCCPDCAVRDKLDFMLIESGVGERASPQPILRQIYPRLVAQV